MFYIVSMELISKSIHHPINKKLRLNSKLLQSGYETHAASSILIRWRTIGRRFDPKTLNSTKAWLQGNRTNVIYICQYVIYFLHYNNQLIKRG